MRPPDTDAEALVVTGNDEDDEDAESDDVQGGDRREHPVRAAPLFWAEGAAQLRSPGGGVLKRGHLSSAAHSQQNYSIVSWCHGRPPFLREIMA